MNFDIEMTVIGELFFDTENKHISAIKSSDFVTEICQEMFELLDKNREVRGDILLLEDCISRNKLKKANIDSFLKCCSGDISLALLEKHILLQKRISRDYKIRKIVENTKTAFSDDDIKQLYKLTQEDFNSKIEVKSASELAHIYPETLENRKRLYSEGMLLPTGYEALDNITGGLMKHNIFVVGGRTSLGKTTFMLNLVTNLAFIKPETNILYFTCEMSPIDLFDRIVSNLSNLEAYKLKYGKIDFAGQEYRDILKQMELISDKSHFNIFYAPGLSLDIVKLAVEKYKPDVIVIDHIQLLKVNGINRAQAIEDAMYEIKGISTENDIAVIVGSQISRESEKGDNKRKDMSPIYFKGSGGIEDCASVCCELRLSENNIKESPVWDIDLDVSKNRFGRINKLQFTFDRQKLKFKEKVYDPESL